MPRGVGDEVHGVDPAPADLTMSHAPRDQDVLPLAEGALSLGQQDFRREVCATAKSACATSAAPGAVRTYEATLRAIVPKITAELGSQVLPMSPEGVLHAFSAVVLAGPKTATSVPAGPAVCWSYG